MSAGSLTGGVLTWRRTSSARGIRIEAAVLGALVLAVAAFSGTAATVAVLVPVGLLFLTLRVGVTSYLQVRAPADGRATTVALLSLVLAGAQIAGTTGLSALAAGIGARPAIALAGLLLMCTIIAVSWTAARKGNSGLLDRRKETAVSWTAARKGQHRDGADHRPPAAA
jgi:hypothetical protein